MFKNLKNMQNKDVKVLTEKIKDLTKRLQIVNSTYNNMLNYTITTAFISGIGLLTLGVLNISGINLVEIQKAAVTVTASAGIMTPIFSALTGVIHLEKKRVKKVIRRTENNINDINKDKDRNKDKEHNKNHNQNKNFSRTIINCLNNTKNFLKRNSEKNKSIDHELIK